MESDIHTITRAGKVFLNSVSKQLPTAMKHREASASTSEIGIVHTRHVPDNINRGTLGDSIQTTHKAWFVILELHTNQIRTSPVQYRKVLTLGEKHNINTLEQMITINETKHSVAPDLVDVVAPFPWYHIIATHFYERAGKLVYRWHDEEDNEEAGHRWPN